MKKTILLIAITLLAIGTTLAQVQVGVGATMGTRTGWELNGGVADFKMNFGLNARVLWEFSDDFAFTGGFSYFLPSEITVLGTDIKYKYYAANADLMYYFFKENDIKLYALGGVNYAFFDFDSGVAALGDDGISWEAGIGANFSKFYVEAKYDANLEQFQGFVGIYF